MGVESMDTLIKDRLEFRRLLQSYSLLDLVGHPNESIEWFRRVMMAKDIFGGDYFLHDQKNKK